MPDTTQHGHYRYMYLGELERESDLCGQCCNIDIERLGAAKGYLHQESIAALSVSAETCELCSLLDTSLMSCPGWSEQVRFLPSSYHLILKRLPQICPARAYETASHTSTAPKAIVYAFIVERGQPVVDLGSNAKDYPEDKSSLFYMELITDEGDPATNFGVPARRRIGENTRSDRSFETARLWLQNCLAQRAELSYRFSSDASNPSRLIEIRPPKDADGAHLRIVRGNTVNQPYSALSYSWGTSEASWRTVTTNIRDRSVGFSLDELPATLQDAIDITEKLGVRYIWIDSCCILQDDEADWLSESVTMGEIYGQALFCVSASSSTSSHDGCYNLRSASNLDEHSELFSITRVLSRGIRSSLYIPRFRYSQWNSLVWSGPLAERAWTYQEKVMSQRTLHYTAKQLFWQCRHGILSEDDIDTGTGPGGDEKLSQWREVIWQTGSHGLETLPAVEDERLGTGETIVRKLERLWYNDVVGNEYSRRRLSCRRDKLVALAGLAKAVQRRSGSRYVAGIWEASLLEGLAWISESPGYKSADYEAPSWSWASQDSRVYYTNFGGATVHLCKVEDIYVQTDGNGDFGRVLDGWLDIEGHIFDVIVEPDTSNTVYSRRSWSARFPHGEKCTATMDDVTFESSTTTALLLLHDEYQINFLLLAATGFSGVYERVGAALIWRRPGVSLEQLAALTASPRSAVRVI